MNFKEYLSDAWATHPTNSKKLADEFKQYFNLMESEDDVMAMTRLIVHVCGEHLGDWTKGIELLRKLKNNATIKDQSEMNRYMAILNLGNNPNISIDHFSPSDQAIIYAGTASALAHLGGLKIADKFLNLASDLSSQLPKEDPANKALAMAGNNIARSLENKNERSESETKLMNLAAMIGRNSEV
jgi:mannitol-specific phosphotransferase system IIBC component